MHVSCVTAQLEYVFTSGGVDIFTANTGLYPVALHLVYIIKIFYILASTPKFYFIIISYLKYCMLKKNRAGTSKQCYIQLQMYCMGIHITKGSTSPVQAITCDLQRAVCIQDGIDYHHSTCSCLVRFRGIQQENSLENFPAVLMYA